MRDRYLAISLAVIVLSLARTGLTAQPDEIKVLKPPTVVDKSPSETEDSPLDDDEALLETDETSLEVLDHLPSMDGRRFFRPRRRLLSNRAAWYFQADALALRRDASSDLSMSALAQSDWEKIENPTYNSETDPASEEYMWQGTISSTINLTVDDASLNSFRGGGRLLLGRSLGRNSVIEVSYFDLAEWRGTTALSNNTPIVVTAAKYGNDDGEFLPTITLAGSLFSPLSNYGDSWIDPLIGPSEIPFDGNNLTEIRYSSSLDNLEWNLRHWIVRDPRFLQISLLIGGRFMNVDESFNYHIERNAYTPSQGTTFSSTTTSVTTNTENPMIGVQLGGTYEAYIAPGWWLDCRLKIALMNNDAKQTTFFTHQGEDSYDGWHQSESNNSKIASAVDATIGTKIYFNRHMTVEIAYQFLYLNGLALAADNFNTDPDLLRYGTSPITTNGDVLYHGARLGVSCAW